MTPAGTRHERRAIQDAQRAQKAMQRLAGMPYTTMLIVRHGETDWNKDHRLQGQLDPGLNANGFQQAQQLAEHFKSRQATVLESTGQSLGPQSQGQQPVIAVYSSDLSRAHQTAQAIADNLNLQVCTTTQLRERCLGVLQGLTSQEAAQQLPDAWQLLLQGRRRAGDTPDDGYGIESHEQLSSRVVQQMEAIAAQHPGETVLVVTHGGPIAAMHIHATGHANNHAAKNGAVHVLVVHGKTWVVVDWEGWLAGPSSMEGFGGGMQGG